MRKSLFLRTDILPEEIPTLFSNKNLYIFFQKKTTDEYYEAIEEVCKKTTVPYYFNIPKDKNSKREMSLLHPIAQLQAYMYMLKYEQLIIEFCSKSKFSVRTPAKLNTFNFDKVKGLEAMKTKLNEEFSFMKKVNITTEEDKDKFFNYFSYLPYKTLGELHNSPKFNRQKYKYKFFVKLDIQDFFPSIYTHALAWAIFGHKAIAKKKRSDKFFANATDNVASTINFGETNGLIIGPEFARVIAEILLTRVDVELHRELKSKSIQMNKDYIINRFLDDYYIFSNDENNALEIESLLSVILQKYKLKLNVYKREIQKRPFKIYNKSILTLNSIMSEFYSNNLYSFIRKENNLLKLLESNNSEDKNYLFIPSTKANWKKLHNQVEKLIYENEDDSGKIVSYFLKALREHVYYKGEDPFWTMKSVEIVSSIYTLNINYRSTNHLIAIYIKLYTELDELKEVNLNNEPMLNNIDKIKESLFHNTHNVLKNNFYKIEKMHDLIVFMKILNKTINSQFLCKILNENKENYFVLCSVAYYILDSSLLKVRRGYEVVLKTLKRNIKSFCCTYESRGTKHLLLDGHYFYIINDFSFYPGFSNDVRSKLRKEVNLLNREHFKEVKGKEIWEAISCRSYFQWDKTTEEFWESVIMKSVNIRYRNMEHY